MSLPLVAHQDTELIDWLMGIVNWHPTEPGDFLKSLADAALRADFENYPTLRPALIEFKKKYPKYKYTGNPRRGGGSGPSSRPEISSGLVDSLISTVERAERGGGK